MSQKRHVSTSRRAYRQMLRPGRSLVPQIHHAGRSVSRSAARSGLHEHRHAGAIELCMVVSGSVRWWVGDERYVVEGGQCYLTRPGELHGGENEVLHPCELRWIVIMCDGTHDEASDDREQLIRELAQSSLRTFAGSAFLQQCYDRLIDAHDRNETLARAAAQAAFDSLLVEAVRLMRQACELQQVRAATEPIEQACRWMRAHLDMPIAMEDLAAKVGLGISRFHERFANELGQSPGDWLTRQRIARARDLLARRSLTITDVALRCGYQSSQYFATAFKRVEGITPSQYRKSLPD